jgi:hypothetical protein
MGQVPEDDLRVGELMRRTMGKFYVCSSDASGTIPTGICDRAIIGNLPFWGGRAVENNQASNRRTDDQLDLILDEVSHWIVNGRQGRALCSAVSLRQATDRAQQYAASGAVVIAVCRQPRDTIIIFAEQLDRLRRIIAARELVRPEAA